MRDALRKQAQPDQGEERQRQTAACEGQIHHPAAGDRHQPETAPNISAIPASMIASCPGGPGRWRTAAGSPAAYRGSAELTSRPKMQLISTSPSPHYAVAAESGSHDITARPCKANVSGKGRIVGLVIRLPRRYIRIQSRRGKANAGVGPPCGRLASAARRPSG